METASIEILLEKLERLVHETDDHPEARLPLLNDVRKALAPDQEAARIAHSDRTERWRYQLLNHWSGRMPEPVAELTRNLDDLTRDLRGRSTAARHSLRDALAQARQKPLPDAIQRCLDPSTPLDVVTQQAQRSTSKNFAAQTPTEIPSAAPRLMRLYAPLYLSNHCINHCLYCGFRYTNAMVREQLDAAQAVAEAGVLHRRGFRHLLLVAGEFPKHVSVNYLTEITSALVNLGFTISVEVAPQSTRGYHLLREAGASGVTLYQETYDEELYAHYHPKGTKAWYDWRLEGPDRAAEAGMHRLGLGILLGLADPLADLRALIAHGWYMQARYPEVKPAFSLPRIREAPEGFEPPWQIDDETFIRFYCALRAAFPDANLVLSTREPASLRDRLAEVCITQMSAGSSTSPGGYQQQADAPGDDRRQFPICDARAPAEVAEWLDARGFTICWDAESVA